MNDNFSLIFWFFRLKCFNLWVRMDGLGSEIVIIEIVK